MKILRTPQYPIFKPRTNQVTYNLYQPSKVKNCRITSTRAMNSKQNETIKIGKETTLFFDMDDTLIDTRYANYLSYKKAVESVSKTNVDFPAYNPNERFSRNTLKNILPNLTEAEQKRIIKQKEKYYLEHLPETTLNKYLMDFLLSYIKTNKIVLVSNCRKSRGLVTLEYHRLIDKFSNTFFRRIKGRRSKENKYKNAIESLNIAADSIVVFENEKSEIKDAILAGIPFQNIIKI